MIRSIRGKFLAWVSTVLIVVIGGFGISLFLLVRRSTLDEIDAELLGTAQLLAEKFRSQRPPPPPGRKKSGMPRPDLRGEPRPEGPPRGPRVGPPVEDIAERIELPERLRLESAGDGSHDFAIWSRDGVLLRASRPGLEIPRPELPPDEGASAVRQRADLRECFVRGPRGTLVLAGRSIARESVELHRLVGYLVGAGSVVLLVGLGGALYISRRALRPIGVISAAAEQISASNLERRIDLEATETELGGLAGTLNSAFDRLQESIERQARFTEDASHELRTPVSVILAQTSMARRKDRSPEEYREVIESCHAAASRMKSLVEGLMTLARTDSGDLQLARAECDFRQLSEECLDLLRPLAAEKGIAAQLRLAEVTVDGDPELLVQAVSNLLSNAIRYNREGGQLCLELRPEGAEAVLSVADTGIGISAEDLPRIFDRFYRVDRARSSRNGGGAGLGLAIAKAIAIAHGGTITCESRPGDGSTFTLRLPLQATVAPGTTELPTNSH
jgi:heavy metal sensor kinase